jgi:hypothetical protein
MARRAMGSYRFSIRNRYGAFMKAIVHVPSDGYAESGNPPPGIGHANEERRTIRISDA